MTRLKMEDVNCLLIPLTDLSEDQPVAYNTLIDKHNISVFAVRHQSQYRVYFNQCPHQGRQLDYTPGKFLCKNQQIICAAHGASFNILSGLCEQGPCKGESLREINSIVEQEFLRIPLATLQTT